MWPVDGVVGENGAFYFRYDHDRRIMRRRYLVSDEQRAVDRRRLLALGKRIVAAVPGAALASD
ncbi:MAG: HAD family hydrolase, partial [Gammaproteobacteria bacterium]|nr:HAD family hydrolase [Gammaproteobacteria bacterium]